MKSRENHIRKIVALWAYSYCNKNRYVSLGVLESQFKRYCEHIMLELVRLGFFCSDKRGWYLTERYKYSTLSEFHEEINKKYGK